MDLICEVTSEGKVRYVNVLRMYASIKLFTTMRMQELKIIMRFPACLQYFQVASGPFKGEMGSGLRFRMAV